MHDGGPEGHQARAGHPRAAVARFPGGADQVFLVAGSKHEPRPDRVGIGSCDRREELARQLALAGE